MWGIRVHLMNRCPEGSMRTSGNDLSHSPYDAAFQTTFDTMGMRCGFSEDILDDPLRQFSGSLILLLYNLNTRSSFNVRPDYFAHNDKRL